MEYRKISQEGLKEILEKHKSLRFADLTDADLTNADLTNADLRYADLTDADLTDADLTNADLSHANLDSTNLTRVNLTNATMYNTNFSNVGGKTIFSMQLYTSIRNRVINYIPDIDWVSAGCFHGTLKDLENKVKSIHADNKKIRKRYEKAIEVIKFLKKDYEND